MSLKLVRSIHHIHTMDQLTNLNRQLAEVRATQARLAEMEKELKTLIAAATAAAEAKQVQEAKQALQDIYTKMEDLPREWGEWVEDRDYKVHAVELNILDLEVKVQELHEKGLAGELPHELFALKTDFDLHKPLNPADEPAPDPDTIVVNASTPTVPKPANDDEEYVPWTVDPAVLTKKLTPSPYVCSYPSSMDAYDLFWLRRDKPVVNKFDIMNHFLSGAYRGWVKVPEEMKLILQFIQSDLMHTSYDVSMTYHLGDAQAKAQEMLDRYNALSSMEDLVRYKYDLVQKRRARSPYAPLLPKGIEYRMHCARQKTSSAAASSSSTRASYNPYPPSPRQKNYLRSLLVEVYGTAAPNQALPAACREFDIGFFAVHTLDDLTGGRDGTASMLISALLAKKRGVQYTPPAPTLSMRSIAFSDDDSDDSDDSDDDLVNPSASSSREEAMERLRSARAGGQSSKAKRSTKLRLKARAESSDDDDDDDDVFSGAAARGKKRRREFLALQLLQQFSNIRF